MADATIGKISAAWNAALKWREDNWEDLLGIAGLGFIWYGVAEKAPWLAWVVIGVLVFAVSVLAKIAPLIGGRNQERDR